MQVSNLAGNHVEVEPQVKNTFLTFPENAKHRALRQVNTDPVDPDSRGLPLLQLPSCSSYAGSDVDTAEPLDAQDVGCGSSDPGSSVDICSTPESTPRYAQSPSPWSDGPPATPEVPAVVSYEYHAWPIAWTPDGYPYYGYPYYGYPYVWPEMAAPQPTAPAAQVITLRMQDASTGLGIDVAPTAEGLLIERVLPRGMVESLNRTFNTSKKTSSSAAARTLVPGNVIISVNGRTTIPEMLHFCRTGTLLKIGVRSEAAGGEGLHKWGVERLHSCK